MQPQIPLTRDLVLIGGGHTHALVLRRWGMRPLPGARLTVDRPRPDRGLYRDAAGPRSPAITRRDELEIDLVRLARYAGARLVLGPAEGIDREARRIAVAGPARSATTSLRSTSASPRRCRTLPGFAAHAVPAKPLGPFAARWQGFLAGRRRTPAPAVVIIGAGIAGVELALAMAHRLRAAGTPARGHAGRSRPRALPGIGAAARRALLRRAWPRPGSG